jgi:hypothetical protein
MPIQKVFAINAEPADIWSMLWLELSQGDQSRFQILKSKWPESLAIEVDVGGLPSRITYTIEPQDGHCEVTAAIEPLSRRYALLQVLTLGKMRTNYELMLAQALVNLKEALEGPPPDAAEGWELVDEDSSEDAKPGS